MTTYDYKVGDEQMRCIITNAHQLLRRKMRRQPLWSLVQQVFGNGSTTSAIICKQVGLDPDRDCGAKELSPWPRPASVPKQLRQVTRCGVCKKRIAKNATSCRHCGSSDMDE